MAKNLHDLMFIHECMRLFRFHAHDNDIDLRMISCSAVTRQEAIVVHFQVFFQGVIFVVGLTRASLRLWHYQTLTIILFSH